MANSCRDASRPSDRLANSRSAYRPQWGVQLAPGGLIWIPPTGIVILLAVLWDYTRRLDSHKELPGQPFEIQATAADWKWIFIDPADDVATVNRLVIPAGRPVHLSLTSATVMQSILMPRLAGQIYAMAAMRTQLNLQADTAGSYLGENVQFSSVRFQDQKFTVDALDPDAFARWHARLRRRRSRAVRTGGGPAAAELARDRVGAGCGRTVRRVSVW